MGQVDALRGGSEMVSLDKCHRASEVKGGEREPIALWTRTLWLAQKTALPPL